LAAVIADLDGSVGIIPVFVGLTFLGGLQAWAVHEPFIGWRRLLGRAVALVWIVAAIWGGALLLLYLWVEGGSRPPPEPQTTYLFLPAAIYHIAGLFIGAVLAAISAFASHVASPRSAPDAISEGSRG